MAATRWLQFLDGVEVWLVTDYRCPWETARAVESVPGVAILTDADGSLAAEYGVEYTGENRSDGSGVTVVLVDPSRRVRLVATGEDAVTPGSVSELRREAARMQSTPADGNQP